MIQLEVYMKHTDRESEEQYLKETLKVIEDNLANYSCEVTRMQAETVVSNLTGNEHFIHLYLRPFRGGLAAVHLPEQM